MRTYTGRPHDVRRVASYENVPRLLWCAAAAAFAACAAFYFLFFFCRYREEEQGSQIPLFSPLFLPLPFFSLFYNLKIMSKEVIANQ